VNSATGRRLLQTQRPAVSLISSSHLDCINCIKPSKGVYAYHLLSTEPDALVHEGARVYATRLVLKYQISTNQLGLLENSLFRWAYQYSQISNPFLWPNRCSTFGNVRRFKTRWYHLRFICIDIILFVWS